MDAKSRGTRESALRLRHADPACVPLRHAAPSRSHLPDSLHQLAKDQLHRPPDFVYRHAHEDGKRERIKAIIHRRRILFAEFVARIKGTRLPKCVMFGELMGGAGCVGGQEKEWIGCLLDDLKAFGIGQWTAAAQDEGEWRKTAERLLWRKRWLQRKSGLDYGMLQ